MNEIHDIHDEEMQVPNDPFFYYNLDESNILDAIDELQEDPITDRNLYYTNQVVTRLGKCNEKAVSSFARSLDRILELDLQKSISRGDFREIRKVIRHTNKITTKMQKSLLDLLNQLSK